MKLDERAILVSLKVSLPATSRRDKSATEDVERVRQIANAGRFNKDLVHKQYFENIKYIESAARKYLCRAHALVR